MSAGRASAAFGSTADERELIEVFSRGLVAQVAPEELVIFDETLTDYFRDPEAAEKAAGRDEAVGFGLDMALVSSAIITVAPTVLGYLKGLVLEAADEELKSRVSDLLRRLIGGAPKDVEAAALEAEVPALDARQLGEVRETALARLTAFGLDSSRAGVLADAIVGGLVRE